jgi:uncharacterized protein
LSQRVSALWRYPVKSFRGERVASARLGPTGLEGDRAYGLRDLASGLILSARRTPPVLRGRAWLDGDRTLASFDDGEPLDPFDERLAASVTDAVGSEVEMVRADEFDTTLPMQGTQGAFTGMVGVLVDAAPILLVTTGALRALGAHTPTSNFDERRFRPNVLIDTDGDEAVERAWIGHEISIGETVLRVERPCGRCALTTRAQDELPHDADVLRTVVQHADNEVGVYASVVAAGELREGDAVTVRA